MDPFNSYMNRLVKYPPDAITATVERPMHPPQWPTNVSQPSVKVTRKKKSTSTRSDHEADRMSNTSEASYEIISNVSSHSPPLLGNNIQTTSTSVQTSESQLTLVPPSESQVVSLHDDPNCGHQQQYIDDLNSQVHSLQAELNSLKYQMEMNRSNDPLVNQVPLPNYHEHWSVTNCGHQPYIDELTCQINSLTDELHSSKSHNEQLLKQIEEMKEEKAKCQVIDQGTDPVSGALGQDEGLNYTEILAAKEEEILSLKNEMDAFRLHSEQIIASERHINARHLSSIQKELRECKNQLSAMTQQASGYKTEIEALKSSLVTQESLTAQLAQEKVTLMSQIESKQTSIDQLNGEIQYLKSNEQLDRREQQSDQHLSREINLNQLVTSSTTDSNSNEISLLNQQLSELKAENVSLRETICRLNDDLKSLKVKSDEEISKLTMDYSARIEQLRDENLKNDSIQTDLEQSLNATRQELLQVLQKLHSITKASMRGELNTVSNQVSVSTSPILISGDQQTIQHSGHRQALLDELEELKKQLALKDGTIEEITTKSSQYAAYYGNEINRLTRELQAANSKTSYLENELVRTQHLIASMHSQQQQLKEAIDKVISSNSKLRNEMINNSLAYKDDALASVQYLEDFLTRQTQQGTG